MAGKRLLHDCETCLVVKASLLIWIVNEVQYCNSKNQERVEQEERENILRRCWRKNKPIDLNDQANDVAWAKQTIVIKKRSKSCWKKDRHIETKAKVKTFQHLPTNFAPSFSIIHRSTIREEEKKIENDIDPFSNALHTPLNNLHNSFVCACAQSIHLDVYNYIINGKN